MIATNFKTFVRLDDDFPEFQILGEWLGREEDSPNQIELVHDTSAGNYSIQSQFRGSFQTRHFYYRDEAIAKFKKLVQQHCTVQEYIDGLA